MAEVAQLEVPKREPVKDNATIDPETTLMDPEGVTTMEEDTNTLPVTIKLPVI
jgi:hypothetical protein